MCRLFGLTAGTNRVKATFWLLDAPDSLETQSRRRENLERRLSRDLRNARARVAVPTQ